MSIATRIESISNHLENTYNELQGLGADLTNVNKNIENISIVLDNIYDSMPQISGEGTNFTLNNTRVGKIKSTFKGNISQEGAPTPDNPIPVNVVSGDNEIVVNSKNFLKLNDIAETTKNGMTYSCKDGVLTLNGTATSGITIDFDDVFLPAGTYYISRNSTGTTSGSWQSYLRNSSENVRQGEGSFTTTEGQYVYFRLYMNSGVVFTNYTFKPMVNLGSTKIDFEPYQGNTYNINFPVENLFKVRTSSTVSQNVTITPLEDGGIRVSGTSGADFNTVLIDTTNPPIINDGTYTSSVKVVGTITKNGKNVIITSRDDSHVNVLGDLAIYSDRTSIKTSDVTGTHNMSNMGLYVDGAGVVFDCIIYVQLEKNSKANTFTPYGTTPIELYAYGNFQDYLYENEGNWYKYGLIRKYTLDGTLNSFTAKHSSIKSDSKGFYQIVLPNKNKTASSGATDMGLSNYFLFRSGSAQNSFNDNSNGLWWEGSSSIIYCILEETSLTNANNWLKTHNTDIYYALGDPEITQITDTTLINQLNTIKNAKSYEEQTNISQNNNDLPFVITANALSQNSN